MAARSVIGANRRLATLGAKSVKRTKLSMVRPLHKLNGATVNSAINGNEHSHIATVIASTLRGRRERHEIRDGGCERGRVVDGDPCLGAGDGDERGVGEVARESLRLA